MKVLVLFEEIPETSCVMLVDMTPEEFAELAPAHAQYLGPIIPQTIKTLLAKLCANGISPSSSCTTQKKPSQREIKSGWMNVGYPIIGSTALRVE